MSLEIKLNQKLSQSLVMTPQLQQAIKLLQLGRLEYLEVLEKELLENPVLEDAKDEGDEHNDSRDSKSEFEGSSEIPDELQSLSVTADEPMLDPNVDWSNYMESAPESWQVNYGARAVDSDEERPSIEATVSKQEGLSSHLLWQLRTLELDEKEQDIAVQIIGNLDRNGYLECSMEELCALCGCDIDGVESVLSVVQSLDPAGVGARDLRECLLIQLNQRGMEDTLVWHVVDCHLGDIESRKFDSIAKVLEVSVEEVYDAIRYIQTLEPRPGRPFVDESPIYITPDIYVRKIGDEYVISLNESGMPKLRVNTKYRDLLMKNNGDSATDAPNKEYLQDRLRSAAWLIKSIHQRQQTIYRVTESIFKFQRDFLEKGVSGLRPLVLRDVAEDVGMHESTVSRVTTNKYVHTPRGVFELKYFFSSGLRSGVGEVSSESVKERIRALISDEDPKKPLSDQAIVGILKDEGVSIARRTVAKYREMMNILSSSRRKKVF
ncbi:MAG: RNA polymerase factor sigma-54 [Bdellovibrionales bacterium]|nr:RNA polymerase factor sigma-54 [Bdellovibrionales bacterium]